MSQASSGDKLLDTLLFDTNIVGIFVWDFDGRILHANDAFLRIVGYEREDLVAGRMRWSDLTPPDLLERQAERLRQHKGAGRLQPFEKEYFRKDGTRVPVLVGVSRFEERATQGVGFVLDLSERKRAEEERGAHLWFLESMDRINRALQGTNDLERMMSDALEAVLEVFACDRAWLVYPCDPEAASWRVVMERTRPEFPGGHAQQSDIPTDASVAAGFAAARASRGVVLDVPAEMAKRFAVRSRMAMALYPKGDDPYLFGLHQCSSERAWTADEQRLCEEIGHRLTDALSTLIAFRSLRESERRLEAAQRLAQVGWWERDYVTGRVALSDEACRIFGVQPVDLPRWHDKWLNLLHPADRERVAAASEAALHGGPRYDVEYRVVKADGAVRVVHSQGDVSRDESGRPLRQFGAMQDITERRRAEDELSEVKERFRVLAESSLTGIYLATEDGFVYANPAMARMFGYAVDEIVGGLHSVDLTCPEDRPLVAENMRRRFQDGVEELRYEFRGLRKDGSMVPVEVHGRRIEHAGKIAVLGTIVDNTERRRAEDELRASELRFRTLVDHAADAFFLIDDALRVVDVNRQACESLGYSRDELVGMHPREFDAALDDPSIARLADRARGGETITFETVHRRKDGSTFPVEIRSHTFVQGGKEFALALVRDITDRKRAEESLRQSEAYLAESQRLSHTGSWALDLATDQYLYRSEESNRMWGFDARGEKPTGQALSERVHPEDRSSWQRGLEKSLREDVATFDEYRIVLPDGTVKHLRTIRHRVLNSAGEVVRLVGTSIDITEHKRAEESLRQSEAYLAEAQRLSHTGSWALDLATNRYVYTSEESDRMWGFDPQGEKPTRQDIFERVHPEDRISWKRNLEKSLGEKVDTFDEYRIVLPDGTVRHLRTIRHPVLNSAGEVVQLVGTSIDITEHKRGEEERERLRRLEVELAHANRLTTMGELTASIAHEVNQPLGAIVANAGACVRWLDAKPPEIASARRALDSVAADARRASDVIARIRMLVKRQTPVKASVDVNTTIGLVIAITEHELQRHGIVLRTHLATGLATVAGDRVGFQQVLLNLILNAAEAMSGIDDRTRELTLVSKPDGTGGVVVEVRDSGTGLDAEHAERLFEPFYSTKKEGLGVGLSICRSIIEAHGGRLWAEPNSPHGAVFRFSLPAEG